LKVQDDGPVGLDGVQVEFDDERVVSDAGVMLVATLAQRLSGEIQPGRRYTRTFVKPGEIDYRCTIHADMEGALRMER
jgi:plastocyanin